MRFRVSALIAGTLVAVLGAVAAGVMYFAVYFGVHAWHGTTPDEAAVDAPLFLIVEALIAPLFTFIGG